MLTFIKVIIVLLYGFMKIFLRISITIFAVIILTFVLFCSIHKLPTKQLRIEDIKSINVLSFNLDRRARYEKKLKSKFGNYFLGHKIGDNIRLLNICNGKKELVAENIVNGKIVTYNDVKDKEGYSVFKDGIWKICSKYKKNECVYYSSSANNFTDGANMYKDNKRFSAFGCFFSHMRAIEKIAKQPDNTYGLILEDDFDVSDDFDNDIKEAFKAVPKDFDMLKITLDLYSQIKGKKKINVFSRIGRARIKSYKKNGYGKWIDNSCLKKTFGQMVYNSCAYLVSAQGARKILSFVRNNLTFVLSDFDLNYYLPKTDFTIKVYSYSGNMPFLVSDFGFDSLIEERNYRDIIKL